MQKQKYIFKQVMKLGAFLALSVLAFLSYSYFTKAQVPDFVNYQGRLRDSSGNPITTPVTIQFSLYTDPVHGSPTDTPSAGGYLLWTETYDGSSPNCQQITPGTDGIFAQHLGECIHFPDYLDFTQQYYLGVKIGSDAEATPRVPLSTHPYAFTSKRLYAEGEDIFITTVSSGNIVLQSAGDILIHDTNNSVGVAGEILSSTGNGLDWISPSSLSAGSLWDTDHDTGIQVEESADEDIIRMDTAGAQRFMLDQQGNLLLSNTEPADLSNPGNLQGLLFRNDKFALRFGETNNNEWNDANIGNGSFASGRNNIVSGNYSSALGGGNNINDVYSVALGRYHTVTGSYAVAGGYQNTAGGYASSVFGQTNQATDVRAMAWGMNNQATADEATAFGYNTQATGARSLSFGRNTVASGAYATAFGYDTTASNNYSLAFGRSTIAGNDYAVAWGNDTNATGLGATAFGYRTTASGQYTLATGYYSEASGNNAVALNDTVANSYMMTAVGRFNVVDSNQSSDTWVDTDYLFVVGNGTGYQNANRSNAFVILKNGTITAPSFSLTEINAAGATALTTKEYVDSRVGNSIFDADADTGIQVEANPDEDYIRMQTAGTERFIIDNNGNTGIGIGNNPLVSVLQIGPGTSEASTFAVAANPAYMNIATFRDQDGENIFRARGSLANDDLIVTFGDWDWAYDHLSFGINTTTDSLDFYGGDFRLHEFAGSQSDYVGFKAPNDVASSVVWTLPSSDGNNGYLLQTDGAGNLSWTNPSTLNITNIYNSNGTLTGDRSVDGGMHALSFNNLNSTLFEITDGASNLTTMELTDSEFLGSVEDGTQNSGFGIQADEVYLYYTESTSGNTFQLDISDTNATIRDDINHRGIEYLADYSANYTDRTLVDKGYVDSLVSSSSFWVAGSSGTFSIRTTGNTASGGDATGNYSVAMGYNTSASTYYAIAEGAATSANGEGSHAEGRGSRAQGHASHAEGQQSVAGGYASHAEGLFTQANGSGSHSEGTGTIAQNNYQFAGGMYNVGTANDTIMEVGIGTGTSNRMNAFEIYTDGSILAPEFSIAEINARGNTSLTTKEYVDNAIATNANNIYNNDGTISEDRSIAGTGAHTVDFNMTDGLIDSGMTYNHTSSELYHQGGGVGSRVSVNVGDYVTITDLLSNRGAVYAADYSANYTNRSLVDKEYVDNQVASASPWFRDTTNGYIYQKFLTDRVGIGTATPDESLVVYDGNAKLSRDGVDPQIILEGRDTGYNWVMGIDEEENIGPGFFYIGQGANVNDTNALLRLTEDGNLFLDNTNQLHHGTQLSIMSDGNSNTDSMLFIGAASDSAYPRIALYRAKNNSASESGVVANDILGQIGFIGRNSTTTDYVASTFINAIATETWTNTAHGAALQFQTSLNGTDAPVRRLEIENDGTLNVAGTTDYELLVTDDDDIPNKAYVDTAIANNSPWTKNGTNLSPTTAGDDILLNAGETLSISDLTQGSIPFIGAGGLFSQDNNNFFWDDTNDRLGLGTSTPSSRLDVVGGNIQTDRALVARGTGTNGEAAHLVVDAEASTLHRLIETRNNNGIQFVVNGNNRVGIGSSNPGAPLHIRNTQDNSGAVIILQNTNEDYSSIFETATNPEGNISAFRGDLAIDGVNGNIYIKNDNDNTNTGWVRLLEEGDLTALWDADSDTGIQVEESADEDMIRFDTAGTQRMRIDNNGLLSYGTEKTDYDLAYFGTQHSVFVVNQEPTAMSTFTAVKYGDDGEPGRISFLKARGSEGAETAVQDGDEIAEFATAAYDGTRYMTTGGLIVKVDGTVGTDNVPSKLEFLTNPGNDLGAEVAMVLNHDGNLGIGVTDPSFKLEVHGDVGPDNSSYSLGSDSKRWLNLYLSSSGGLNIGSNTLGYSNISYNTSVNRLTLQNSVDSTNGFQFLDADGGTPILSIDTTDERVGIGTASPAYKLTISGGALMLEDSPAPTASQGFAGIYTSSGELYAFDDSGNSTQISPHNKNGEWWYNSTNVRTGQTLQIEMERLMKELNKTFGGGYIKENGQEIDLGENILNVLSLKTNQNINSLSDLQKNINQNLLLINDSLKEVNKQLAINQENIEDNENNLKTLSANINSLTELTTNLTNTLSDHEKRISKLESILKDNGANLDQEEKTDLPKSLQIFAENLKSLQKEGKKVEFTLDGKLVVEEIKTEKLEAKELATDNLTISDENNIGTATIKAGKKKVVVETDKVSAGSHIILTPHGAVVVGVGKIKKGESFEIVLAKEAEEDIKVEWLLVNRE